MKRLVIAAGLGFVVVLGLIFTVAAFQAEDFEVERSIIVQAPTSELYEILTDLQRFDDWSPWAKRDPNMVKTFDGPASGTGSSYSWEGNDQVGSGRMTIVSVVPNQQIDVKLEFFKPWTSTNTTIWKINETDSGTEVSWTMKGKNESLMFKAMGLFMNMDKMLGKDFEEGLASLAKLAQN